ncbi:MAG: hypothetical protein ACJ8MO_31110, partial [Bacillus sp. (in: firmicutes)]
IVVGFIGHFGGLIGHFFILSPTFNNLSATTLQFYLPLSTTYLPLPNSHSKATNKSLHKNTKKPGILSLAHSPTLFLCRYRIKHMIR